MSQRYRHIRVQFDIPELVRITIVVIGTDDKDALDTEQLLDIHIDCPLEEVGLVLDGRVDLDGFPVDLDLEFELLDHRSCRDGYRNFLGRQHGAELEAGTE